MPRSEDCVGLAIKVDNEMTNVEMVKLRMLHLHSLVSNMFGDCPLAESLWTSHDELEESCKRIEELVTGKGLLL